MYLFFFGGGRVGGMEERQVYCSNYFCSIAGSSEILVPAFQNTSVLRCTMQLIYIYVNENLRNRQANPAHARKQISVAEFIIHCVSENKV
jgi:hypothetical protein